MEILEDLVLVVLAGPGPGPVLVALALALDPLTLFVRFLRLLLLRFLRVVLQCEGECEEHRHTFVAAAVVAAVVWRVMVGREWNPVVVVIVMVREGIVYCERDGLLALALALDSSLAHVQNEVIGYSYN